MQISGVHILLFASVDAFLRRHCALQCWLAYAYTWRLTCAWQACHAHAAVVTWLVSE